MLLQEAFGENPSVASSSTGGARRLVAVLLESLPLVILPPPLR